MKKTKYTGEWKITYTLEDGTQKSKIVEGHEVPEAIRKLNENKKVKYYWKVQILGKE